VNPLLSKGSCIVAYLAVDAQQRAYMLQYHEYFTLLYFNYRGVITILKPIDKSTQEVTFLNCIQEAIGSNLDLGVDYYEVVHNFL
jgi:expansin (peptidoglycan-binding protein)